MEPVRRVSDDLHSLASYLDVPMLGLVPVNAYLLMAREPMLVDTGMAADSPQFLDSVRSAIDPQDLRWIWLTHPDADHTGSLHALLAEAPRARVITTFLGFGIMGLTRPLPLDRVYFLNPGETIDLGDRRVTALTLPTFDNPSTTGCYDPKSGALFSADSFGAVLSSKAEEAAAVPAAERRHGQLLWETIDHPWVRKIDRRRLAEDLDGIRRLDPRFILSGHLPAACGLTREFLETLAEAPDAAPYVGPNQAALESMLAQAGDQRVEESAP